MLGGNITAIFIFFPGTSSVRTVTNSVLASHLQSFFRLQPTFGLIENSQTKVPGLAAAVAGTTMAEEGSVVGGKDGCLRIVPYCPMKEPSSSNGMAEKIGNSLEFRTGYLFRRAM